MRSLWFAGLAVSFHWTHTLKLASERQLFLAFNAHYHIHRVRDRRVILGEQHFQHRTPSMHN